MASLRDTSPDKQKYKQLLGNLGEASLHALFPEDFEAYLVSMELVDSKGNTESFISFPIQPSQISETSTRITNVRKTTGGVVALSTQSFVPIDIDIKGSFGRNLRFTVGNTFVEGGLVSFVKNGGKLESGRPSFSSAVKTGYGMVKAVEDMLDSSDILDSDGKPKKLYLYNTILGNNYICKVKNFVHSQDESQNRIPQYTIQLTAVAPLDISVQDQDFRIARALTIQNLNVGMNQIANNVKNVLGI
tara:strand:+ start:3970 stop:4707 length:738 start_codon:yes stop_codon:yes gene_type:complete